MVLKVNVLDEAAKVSSNQDSWWWLKADGCDVLKGLKESTKMEWSGDVDLADGSVQKQHEKYKQRLDHASKVGLNRASTAREILTSVKKDLEFLHSGNVYCLMYMYFTYYYIGCLEYILLYWMFRVKRSK